MKTRMRDGQPWLMGPAGDRSAGMLPSPHNGMTSPVVASGIRARDRVALTIEPEGGTSHPDPCADPCHAALKGNGAAIATQHFRWRVASAGYSRPLVSAALIGPGPIVTAP